MTTDMTDERRSKRSAEITDALTLWFDSVARRCGSEVVALATATGKPVITKEVTAATERRTRSASGETALLPIPKFRHGDQPLVLWARGARGTARAAVNEAAPGLLRILEGHF